MIDTEIKAQMDRMESMLADLMQRHLVKDFYSVEEFATQLGKAAFTVRNWARLGRINAVKKGSGRGTAQEWAIPHTELLRYQRDGLIPLTRRPS